MDAKTKKYALIGGGALLVLFLLMKKGGGSDAVAIAPSAEAPPFDGLFTPQGATNTANIPGLSYSNGGYSSSTGGFSYAGGGINMLIEGPNNQWPEMRIVNNATIEGSNYSMGGSTFTSNNAATIGGSSTSFSANGGGGCCCDDTEPTKTIIGGVIAQAPPAAQPQQFQGYGNWGNRWW